MQKKYQFSRELFDQINDEFGNDGFSSFSIGYPINEEKTLFEIEEWYVDRLVENLDGFNQWFMDNFSKSAKNYLSENTIYPYRILDIVSDDFKFFPIENIDFTIHLPKDIALDKGQPIYDERGRPVEVDYYYQDVLMAKRRWVFDLNPLTFFPEKKKVYQCYYREDGSLGEEFLTKYETLDMEKKPQRVLEELEKGRNNNVKTLKILILRNLQVADPTRSFSEVLFMLGELFDHYAVQINNFINTGIAQSGTYSDEKYIIDMIFMDAIGNPTEFPFLQEPYFADNNYKLFEIMIALLDY